MQSLQLESLQTICQMGMLQSLELGNCDKIEPSSIFDSLKSLKNLKYLRLEKGKFDVSIGEMKTLTHLRVLELIDFEMVQGFGKGLVELQNIRKLLLIPTYTDEVSASDQNWRHIVKKKKEIFSLTWKPPEIFYKFTNAKLISRKIWVKL